MIVDQSIKTFVDFNLTAKNMVEAYAHENNSRLTASFLWQPKRFQLLKYIGFVDKPAPDPYALRKFKRGKDVENHIVTELEEMGIVVAKQKELTYRGVYGLADTVIDPTLYDESKILAQYDPQLISLLTVKDPGLMDNFYRVKSAIRNLPKMPLEVKSVTNRSYKWVVDKGEISWHYKVQAGFYGLAEGSEHFGLGFLASDDLREHVTIHKTREMKADIDKIITEYEQMCKDWDEKRIIPTWEVHDKWMENPNYMAYDPFWATATQEEWCKAVDAMKKIQEDIMKGKK